VTVDLGPTPDAARDDLAGPRPAPEPILQRLIGATTPATFAEEHWGRAPLLVVNADARGFGDLLDLDGVDDLLSRRGLRTPFVRLARDGTVLGSSSFTAPGGVGAEVGDQVRDDKVADQFRRGATVVLQALHRTWSPVVDLATDLGAELGHPVQVNAYITPPGSRGFSAHYDVHDVFVLQLAGTKCWTVHEPVHPDPLRSQPWNDHATAIAERAHEQPFLEVTLRPGDALYLPRGWLHAATAEDEVSAHLTVGVHVTTRYALVEAVLAAVASDPRLRTSLPIGLDLADPASIAPHLELVREVLHEAIDTVDPPTIARAVRRRSWGGSRVEPVRPLAVAAFARHLGSGDVVRARRGPGAHIGSGPDGAIALELPDRTISLPAATGPAMRALLTGDTCVVGDLPGLPEQDQIVLVRRLLHEGVVVPVTG
jgi:ribosomal protein L16 Arg81 hydroxylase